VPPGVRRAEAHFQSFRDIAGRIRVVLLAEYFNTPAQRLEAIPFNLYVCVGFRVPICPASR